MNNQKEYNKALQRFRERQKTKDLDELYDEFDEVNAEHGIYIGEEGLERAKAELMAFEHKYGRLPKASDKVIGGIKGAIKRGKWVCFGIKSWSDLLEKRTSFQDT